MKVARLNASGLATFAGWLESLKVGGSIQAPTALLTDEQNTEPLWG